MKSSVPSAKLDKKLKGKYRKDVLPTRLSHAYNSSISLFHCVVYQDLT